MKFLELDNNEIRGEYLEYMDSIKKKYPKKLYDTFVKSDRFHDYLMLGFRYFADTTFFKEKSDKLILALQSDIADEERFLKIQFDLINYIKFESKSKDLDELDWFKQYSTADRGSKKFAIGRVYYSEIGINEEKQFTFELLSEKGFKLYIAFNKCRILENKRM